MKKILIILLIVCFVAGTGIVALAKAEFGNWDKWDKELPPWDNEGWIWEGEYCCSRIISFPPGEDTPVWVWEKNNWKITTIIYPPIVKDVFSLFLIRLSFSGNKEQASVIFLSSADKDTVDNNIKNIKNNLDSAEFAIAAFPPKKGKVVIRVYENKNGLFQFVEKWTESFEGTPVFPAKKTKFTEKYREWFDNQLKNVDEETRQWLQWLRIMPRLVILEDKNFFLGIGFATLDRRAQIPFFY